MRGLTGALALAVSLTIASTCLVGQVSQETETGSVGGHVRLTGRLRGVPLPSNVYQSRSVNRHDAGGSPEILNVVVYLKDAVYRGTLPFTRREIRQEHETFLPHVLAVARGSTVDFLNADPFFHNVFSLSSTSTFDLGRYPQGQTRAPRTFNRAGLVKVYCHIHSQMSASILVLDHPYFVIPDFDGSYNLPNVPAGRYTIAAWHERVGERTMTIEVRPGTSTSIDLALPVDDVR